MNRKVTIKEARELLNGLGVETDELQSSMIKKMLVSHKLLINKDVPNSKLNFQAKIYTHYKISDLLDLNKNIIILKIFV